MHCKAIRRPPQDVAQQGNGSGVQTEVRVNVRDAQARKPGQQNAGFCQVGKMPQDTPM